MAATDTTCTEVEITFNAEDLLQIKLNDELAIADTSSFISLQPGAIKDTSGNNVMDVTPVMALMVSSYRADDSSLKVLL